MLIFENLSISKMLLFLFSYFLKMYITIEIICEWNFEIWFLNILWINYKRAFFFSFRMSIYKVNWNKKFNIYCCLIWNITGIINICFTFDNIYFWTKHALEALFDWFALNFKVGQISNVLFLFLLQCNCFIYELCSGLYLWFFFFIYFY